MLYDIKQQNNKKDIILSFLSPGSSAIYSLCSSISYCYLSLGNPLTTRSPCFPESYICYTWKKATEQGRRCICARPHSNHANINQHPSLTSFLMFIKAMQPFPPFYFYFYSVHFTFIYLPGTGTKWVQVHLI